MNSSSFNTKPQASTQMCDAHRLESYLQGELSAASEQELTAHLNECLRCRARLEHLAAEPAAWDEAELFLKHDGLNEEYDAAVRTQRPLQMQHVLAGLAPTDDPEMLGRLLNGRIPCPSRRSRLTVKLPTLNAYRSAGPVLSLAPLSPLHRLAQPHSLDVTDAGW